ncbi:hypothetical protein ABK040_009911 [Willaertia magna]
MKRALLRSTRTNPLLGCVKKSTTTTSSFGLITSAFKTISFNSTTQHQQQYFSTHSHFNNNDNTASSNNSTSNTTTATTSSSTIEESKEITIDEFLKSEIVIGQIKKVSFLPKSKKLILFHVDIGEEEESGGGSKYRTICSGIRLHYSNSLKTESDFEKYFLDKKVLVVKNLIPRNMMGVLSHGMILFATTTNANTISTSSGVGDSNKVIDGITPVIL